MNYLKKHWFQYLGYVAIIMALLLSPSTVSAAGTIKQFYGTGTANNSWQIDKYSGAYLFANANYTLTQVEFWVARQSTSYSGTYEVHLYEADGAYKPTGSVLSSGSVTVSSSFVDKTVDYDGAPIIIDMTDYALTSTLDYVFVFKPASGNYGLNLHYQTSGGKTVQSTDNGSTWTVNSSNQIHFTTYGYYNEELPAAPSSLAVSWDYGDHGSYLSSWLPELTWTDNSSNETNWDLQMSDNSGFTNNVVNAYWSASVAQPAWFMFGVDESYQLEDWTAWEAETLYFRVRAVNTAGVSDWSNTATLATFEGYEDLVQKPINLTATLDSWSIGVAEMYGIVLEWDNPHPSGTGYLVQRASNNLFSQNVSYYDNTSNNNFGKGNLGISETAFSDWWYIHNLGPVTWYYRVMAINPLGSNEVTLTTSIQFGGQVTYATIIGSEWSNVASCVLDATDIEDIEGSGVIPPGTTPPTVTEGGTGNPFSGMTWFNEPWFPYAAMFILMMTVFGIAIYLSRDRKIGVIFGGVGAMVVMGIFITLNWINGLIIMALAIAVAVIFLLPKVVGR